MEESKKWTMLFLYSFLQWFGGTIWISYSTISLTASEYYKVSLEVINYFSLIFLVMQLPMAPLSSYMLRKSYHWTMMIAYLISTLGVWLKVIAQDNVGLALFGQGLIAAMNSLTLGACSTLTAIWFKPHEQVLAVAIASTSNLLGAACGLVLSPYISDLNTLLYIQASYTTFAALLNIIFSRKRKPHDSSEQRSEFRKEINLLFNDWYLLALIFFISSGLAIAYALSGVIFQVVYPFGLSENDSGWIGFSLYIGAIIGGCFTSLLVHKSKNFIKPVRAFALISLTGILIWAGFSNDFYGNIIGATISGFGLFGFLPLGIQAAVDQNKNIEESLSTNLIFLVAQSLSVAYTYPIIYFYKWLSMSGLWLAVICAFMSFCSLLILYCPKFIEKYRQPLIVPQAYVKDEIVQDENNNF